MPEGIAETRNDLITNESRRLTFLYIFALSTVAILSIGAQWLVQRQLHNGKDDSHVINIAGRQRMLSQRLAKASLKIEGPHADSAKEELAETLATWSKNHYGLQKGDTQLGLPATNSREVIELFESIEPHFVSMQKSAEYLLKENNQSKNIELAVNSIQEHESSFLLGMDKLVYQFVSEAEARVQGLRRLEFIILWLTLGVLIAEGFLIFRPAVRHIESVSKWLRQAKDEAESANAAKTRFLANVSHELRTPMTAVLGMTELAKEAKSQNEIDDYLHTVEEAGESLLSLLNDLIDIASIDANQIKLTEVPIDPQSSIQRVARMMGPAAKDKSLDLIVVEQERSFPTVMGDRRRLDQILINFVANAIKCTAKGSVALQVELLASDDSTVTYRYSVRDSGVGISAEDQTKIFEPFFQSPSSSQAHNGVGLGLAICRKIADAMGATIDLESKPNVGTKISITSKLPILADQKESIFEERVSIENTIKVLVIEDTKVNQLLIQKYLELDGHQVELVSDGASAIELYQKSMFDLVLIDLNLPDFQGDEVAKKIREHDAVAERLSPPLVCITAHANYRDEVDASCFNAFITKPIDKLSFYRVISEQFTKSAIQLNEGYIDLNEADGELAEAFVSIADEQLDELQKAAAEKHLEKIQLLAHRFRGQVGYFDSGRLDEDFANIEEACVKEDQKALESLLPEVIKSTRQLSRKLANSLGKTKSVS